MGARLIPAALPGVFTAGVVRLQGPLGLPGTPADPPRRGVERMLPGGKAIARGPNKKPPVTGG